MLEQLYWEYTVSGICAYVGIGTQSYSLATIPGLGADSWAIGDFGFGAELMTNTSSDLGIDIRDETGLYIISVMSLLYDMRHVSYMEEACL